MNASDLPPRPLSERAHRRGALRAPMRAANLARWPTGALIDFDEAVERHRRCPRHKQLAG
jgi:hypothetical protein